MGKIKRKTPLDPGITVGHRLTVVSLLGSGTFANVYRCSKANSSKQYALKVVTKDDLGPYEAEILQLISDRQSESYYCMKLLRQFTYRKVFKCLVMPIYGPSCFDVLKLNNFRGLFIQRVRDLALGIFAGLQFLNDLNIIHTDIKPENIVLRREGDYRHPIIIDFGSAVYEHPNNTDKITTEAYRAPEVEIGTQPGYGTSVPLVWNSAVDVWSAGCVLYELWKGVQLFEKDPELDLIYMINDIIGHLPYRIPPRKVDCHLTTMLKDTPCNTLDEKTLLGLISQCLTPFPAHRPAAAEILHQLRLWDM
jgi:serine/threonine protein kinase